MRKISDNTIRRLSLYLQFLEQSNMLTVSSRDLAWLGGTTSAQVRRDLSAFGSFGRRGLGYPVVELTRRIRGILGLERPYRVILVGAGKIGSALVEYSGFRSRGFTIVGIYDNDPKKIGANWNGLRVLDIRRLERDLNEEPSDIGIVVTSADAAQEVTNALLRGGIKAILNFAPVQLSVPEGVVVRNVNMAHELESLTYSLANLPATPPT